MATLTTMLLPNHAVCTNTNISSSSPTTRGVSAPASRSRSLRRRQPTVLHRPCRHRPDSHRRRPPSLASNAASARASQQHSSSSSSSVSTRAVSRRELVGVGVASGLLLPGSGLMLSPAALAAELRTLPTDGGKQYMVGPPPAEAESSTTRSLQAPGFASTLEQTELLFPVSNVCCLVSNVAFEWVINLCAATARWACSAAGCPRSRTGTT
jgi:hypothetical protein